MAQQGPIGVFDSGYGGLTVLKEIIKKLPDYDYLYLGDNARAPYGTRSYDSVYQYTIECVKWFFKQGCPLVILACNTASAKALRTIQQKDLPVIAPENKILDNLSFEVFFKHSFIIFSSQSPIISSVIFGFLSKALKKERIIRSNPL